jgi:hypothetical protein
MGLTKAQRYNRMMDRIWLTKAEYDRRAVEAAHSEAEKEDIRRDLVKRYAYMEGTEEKTS